MKINQKISWLIFFALVLVDQLIKWGVRGNFAHWQYKNPGVSLGFFSSTPPLMLNAVAILVFVIFIYVWRKYPSRSNIPVIMIGAGAISNLADRIFLGYITDYINLGFWSTFNLADVLILVGAGIYGYQILRHK